MCEVLHLPGSKNSNCKCIANADCLSLYHCSFCIVCVYVFVFKYGAVLCEVHAHFCPKANLWTRTIFIFTHNWLYTHQTGGIPCPQLLMGQFVATRCSDWWNIPFSLFARCAWES